MHIIPRYLLAVALVPLLFCGNPVQPDQGEITKFQFKVRLQSARYDNTTGLIRLQWEIPPRSVPYFRVYRTNETGMVWDSALGDYRLQPINFTSTSRQLRLPGNVNIFNDVIGLATNTRFYYQVRVAIIDSIEFYSGRFDTSFVEGPPSNTDSVTVGSGVSFSINYGDLYLTIDTCKFVVVDPSLRIQSATFTTAYTDTGTGTKIGKLPNFDGIAPLPCASTINEFIWALPKGGGDKFAWAKLAFKSGQADTVIQDDIKSKPYRVSLKIRNSLVGAQKEMVQYKMPDKGNTDGYTLFRPWVYFSILTYSDTTFDTTFDYWTLFTAEKARLVALKEAAAATAPPWYETGSKRGHLTGIGSAHDILKTYKYVLHPDSAEGMENLDTLHVSIKRPKLALYDSSSLSSYWGVYDTLKVGNPQDHFKILKILSDTDTKNFGKKEFALVLRFKGRYFNEVRTILSTQELSGDVDYSSYLDFYPPLVKLDQWDKEVPEDGSEITKPFNVNINKTGIATDADGWRGWVRDLGGAKIKAVDLVFAECPQSLIDDWSLEDARNLITLDVLATLRNRVFPFPLQNPVTEILPYWDGIDPTSWPSGWYLMIFVTEDEFGNRGIPPLYLKLAANFSNPQHLKIVTNQ